MKKLLIVIPWTRYYVGNRDCPFASSPERAPEGVVGLATYLISKGADVRIADTLYMLRLNDGDTDATLTQLWETCADFKPDVIGFSFFTARFECAAQIFDDLRLRYAHSDTSRQPMFIAGGVHPTLLPQVTLQYMPLDAVVVGEGELPLLELLDGKHPREIKGIFMPGDVHVEKANVVECLDDLPVPDWSLIDIDHYTQPSYQISNTRLLRTMPVTFGRGCLYRCNFCAHNCFLRARHHSANYFVAKMRQVAQQCGIDTFVVQDSSIGNFSDEWAEVCRQLIAMDSPFRWWANLRANQANRRLLQLMKQAGAVPRSGDTVLHKLHNKLLRGRRERLAANRGTYTPNATNIAVGQHVLANTRLGRLRKPHPDDKTIYQHHTRLDAVRNASSPVTFWEYARRTVRLLADTATVVETRNQLA